MFCKECGTDLDDNAKFCSNCGTAAAAVKPAGFTGTSPASVAAPIEPMGYAHASPASVGSRSASAAAPMEQAGFAGASTVSAAEYQNSGPENHAGLSLIGFSSKISDPAFAKYKSNSRKAAFIFAGILALIALAAVPIYASKSGKMEVGQAFIYGAVIGGMFLFIALVQSLKGSGDSTWDGVVIDKSSHRRTDYDTANDTHTHYTEFVLKVRRDNGRVYTNKTRDLPGALDYYNIGEKVRHHKGFQYYEKYDKSGDTRIMCAACLTFNEIQNERCKRCKCPLLK